MTKKKKKHTLKKNEMIKLIALTGRGLKKAQGKGIKRNLNINGPFIMLMF